MPADQVQALLIDLLNVRIKRMGAWAGIRFLRNKGVPFKAAHLIVLGFAPRFA